MDSGGAWGVLRVGAFSPGVAPKREKSFQYEEEDSPARRKGFRASVPLRDENSVPLFSIVGAPQRLVSRPVRFCRSKSRCPTSSYTQSLKAKGQGMGAAWGRLDERTSRLLHYF